MTGSTSVALARIEAEVEAGRKMIPGEEVGAADTDTAAAVEAAEAEATDFLPEGCNAAVEVDNWS